MPTDDRQKGESAELMAGDAIHELRAISDDASNDHNRASAARAAVIIEGLIQNLRQGTSGRQVILELLDAAHPDPVPTQVLRHASGIQEFARRIRELRADGYRIESLGDSYRLDRDE